ncbi:hypothetical protein [Aeromicrobium sp. P5_D10]
MSRRSHAKTREFASPFGWPATIDTAGVVTVFDTAGQVRATYQGGVGKYSGPNLSGGGTHTIRLPEGDVVLNNGAKKATRRHTHNGHLDLHGRHYEFLHTRRWKTEVRCEGVRVALLRRRSSRTFKIRVNAIRDETDLLATVLCWYAVRPGRQGAIASAFDGL